MINILELGVRQVTMLYCEPLHELDVAFASPALLCSWNS